MTYLECWQSVATALFSQALAGEPSFSESLPRPLSAGTFGFAALLTGDVRGRFSVVLDPALKDASFVGEGADQEAGWKELLREVAEAATGELLTRTGLKCRVEEFQAIEGEAQITRSFQLKANGKTWSLLVRDQTQQSANEAGADAPIQPAPTPTTSDNPAVPIAKPGVELLLDVELEAALRFGCREMPLGEILDMGPGDVVELDRHVADPVDLIVGDKIVARGEVVLVNGNFGLRVTEVAEPQRRLESIRCLF